MSIPTCILCRRPSVWVLCYRCRDTLLQIFGAAFVLGTCALLYYYL